MKILKKILLFLISLLIFAFFAFLTIFATAFLTEKIFLPKDYLFYEHSPVTGIILIFILLIPSLFLCYFVLRKLRLLTQAQIENFDDEFYLWNRLGKFKIAVIFVWLIALYVCFTNITVVTDNSITVHTHLSPRGKTFSYSEVENIETGFGNKKLAFCDYKEEGNFFYIIKLEDKKIVFHQPTPNSKIERYNNNTYLELEEFDNALKTFNIPKSSNSRGYEKCYYDEEIINRFLKIIEN